MSDYRERACTRCGSLLHHEDKCTGHPYRAESLCQCPAHLIHIDGELPYPPPKEWWFCLATKRYLLRRDAADELSICKHDRDDAQSKAIELAESVRDARNERDALRAKLARCPTCRAE